MQELCLQLQHLVQDLGTGGSGRHLPPRNRKARERPEHARVAAPHHQPVRMISLDLRGFCALPVMHGFTPTLSGAFRARMMPPAALRPQASHRLQSGRVGRQQVSANSVIFTALIGNMPPAVLDRAYAQIRAASSRWLVPALSRTSRSSTDDSPCAFISFPSGIAQLMASRISRAGASSRSGPGPCRSGSRPAPCGAGWLPVRARRSRRSTRRWRHAPHRPE